MAEALTKEKTTEDPPGKKPPESAKTKGAKAAVPESEDEKAAEKVPRYPPPGGVPEVSSALWRFILLPEIVRH